MEVEKHGFRTAWLITGQKFPWKNLKSGSSLLTFRDPSSHICEIILWIAKCGDLDFGSCSQIWIFPNTFLWAFWNNGTGQRGAFSKPFFAGIWKWEPDIFPKSQILKISSSSHSKNAHIRINLDSWCRAERCGPPLIFFWAGCWDSAEIWRPAPPTRAVYPPEVGQ